MKNKDRESQLFFDFSTNHFSKVSKPMSALRLVHSSCREPVTTHTQNSKDIRAKVLENLLKTRIPKA
ncbi:MAG: hypothetical protein Q7T21_02245 [Gallionella sp.]|nr:hypothetical protein [Gallionella sp.]